MYYFYSILNKLKFVIAQLKKSLYKKNTHEATCVFFPPYNPQQSSTGTGVTGSNSERPRVPNQAQNHERCWGQVTRWQQLHKALGSRDTGGSRKGSEANPLQRLRGASVPSRGWTSFLLTQLVKDRAREILGSHNKKGEIYTEKEIPPFFRVDT